MWSKIFRKSACFDGQWRCSPVHESATGQQKRVIDQKFQEQSAHETMSRKWNARPSALALADYAEQTFQSLVTCYVHDSETASKCGISIPPKPQEHNRLRTLQWNIHYFTDAQGRASSEVTCGIIHEILRTDADVICLNEYADYDRYSQHSFLEKQLLQSGYTFRCATKAFPTFLAVKESLSPILREISLSESRSAIVAELAGPGVVIAGTHLDFANGPQRHLEMSRLLEHLKPSVVDVPMFVVGDLNQQRQVDYASNEWKRIANGMDRRRAPRDDGVDSLLQQARFQCPWDTQSPLDTNWETTYPPSTHWSGTIVDYSYGNQHTRAQGCYISPAQWSDHRMTVCDWEITREEENSIGTKGSFFESK